MMTEALYTCLSSENYLAGVLALNRSLKLHTEHNLHVLCTEHLFQKYNKLLVNEGIEPELGEKIDLPESFLNNISTTEYGYWKNTFIKLTLFNLTKYEKILYLDSDMMVTGNIEPLFELNELSAVDDGTFMLDESHHGINSGTLLIKPNTEFYKQLIDSIPKVISLFGECGDQDVLQYVLDKNNNGKFNKLPIIYNANAYKLDAYSLPDEINVIHFISGNKPWMWGNSYRFLRMMNYWIKGRRKTYRALKQYFELLK